MSKFRRDVLRMLLLTGQFRIALCFLFLPPGWSLTKRRP